MTTPISPLDYYDSNDYAKAIEAAARDAYRQAELAPGFNKQEAQTAYEETLNAATVAWFNRNNTTGTPYTADEIRALADLEEAATGWGWTTVAGLK